MRLIMARREAHTRAYSSIRLALLAEKAGKKKHWPGTSWVCSRLLNGSFSQWRQFGLQFGMQFGIAGHASIRFQVAGDEQSSSKVYFSTGDS